MSTRELYSKGARVWIPHEENVWQGAKITENYTNSIIKLVTDDGEVKDICIKSNDDLPPLRNPDILIGENDLTSLSYLHEPAVLYNLQVRFCRHKAIYTYCGIVLVAINPYQDISIYGSDTIWAYRNRAMGDLDPHIFAVAEEAYTKMEREQTNQSIIVSGESGAGKTVSAKYAMRYFATVGGSATETQVERKVLASSPIMEAIGNAKTIRNDNSSRFGKYIELQFSKHYRIVGASMRTYLLEKSRVVFQSPGERNYHVFYQMCAVRDSLPHLSLGDASEYSYLCDSDCSIPGVDDSKAYEDTVSALAMLGFPQSDISDIFSILASVLHLGNILFDHGSHGDESSSIQAKDPHLLTFSNLLGIDSNELRQWLCHRKIVSTRETFNKPMSMKEATGARDALAKHIYAQLFAWIVDMVNKALYTSGETKIRFIGVLDIYGFETFDVNSFEQFCINYANEKLQQQFNMHVFKLEQEEYLKEDIEWKFIDFYDNQPCIDLIESKLGILDLLDEECRMPKGSDSSWAEKLYAKCVQRSHFVKPRFGTNSFIVKHFADKVEYEVYGFLEKNRDTVIEEQVTALKGSSNRLVTRLFCENGEADGKLAVPKPRVRVSIQQKAPPTPQPTSRNKKTVGSQFRDSLNALMGTLNATTPHYIRCIKPNDEKAAFKYNPRRAVQQLRACGVLETIRISAAGFPSRWLYIEFYTRYRVLFHSKEIDRNDMQITCQTILNKVIKDNDKYKFGRTKIFFRAGQVAYLERLRSERLLEVVVRIQKHIRGFLVRRSYTRTLTATNTLQRYVRGFLGRRRAEGIRRNRAATKIQACVRRYLARTVYLRLTRTALGLQARGRGLLARRKFISMKQNRAAIMIQKHIRGWLVRKKCTRLKRNIILVQSIVRRHLARKRFRTMKREARSAEHLKKLNKGLENKIIELQQKVGELGKELKTFQTENVDLRTKVENFRSLEIEVKSVTKLLKNKEIENTDLQNKWEESSKLLNDRMKEVETFKLNEKSLEATNNRLQNEVSTLRNTLEQLKNEQQEKIRAQLQEEKKAFEEERAEHTVRYQKLLADHNFLESKLESLEAKHHKRSSSDVSTISAQDDDVGYASVRSTGSSIRDETSTPDYNMDLGLVLKYQQKLRELEVENYRLRMKLEASKNSVTIPPSNADPLIIQELEMENEKLRNNLTVLKECIASDAINESSRKAIEEMTREWKESEREVHRLRAENVELRKMFSGAAMSAKSLAQSSYSSLRDLDSSIINEDGELVLAFEAQKRITRQLEDELQSKTREWEVERELLVRELEKVRGELERERAAVASGAPSAYFEEHVTRLCSENLDLQEKLDQQSAKSRKLSQQVANLTKRIREAGVEESDSKSGMKSEMGSGRDGTLPKAMVRKKEREYSGMFEIKREDIDVMLKHLLELKPRVAVTLLPALPAYILFMCVRYTDYINIEDMVQNILLGYRKSLMKLVRKNANDVELGILWLSNTLRLINNLKQYSGDKEYSKENTQTQNEQCLKNFDLREFQKVLSDAAVSISQTVVRAMEERIQPLAISAILDYEALSLASSGGRARSGSTASSQPCVRKAMEDLETNLTMFHRSLNLYGIDTAISAQFFRQLFYCLCANALNNLLLKKDYCHWMKGIQIRFNLSFLEQWIRDNQFQEYRVLESLAPIIQASQLLQAGKKDSDVEAVANMCSALSVNQIIKLLNLYTADGVEERVSESFIVKVQNYLLAHRPSADNTLMMDVKHAFPLEFPFVPSVIRLEDVDIPDILKLPMLKKI